VVDTDRRAVPDARLQSIVNAWDSLPESVRADIVTMVNAGRSDASPGGAA
jgi:hypothetical protein